jgi:hypothetical protein
MGFNEIGMALYGRVQIAEDHPLLAQRIVERAPDRRTVLMDHQAAYRGFWQPHLGRQSRWQRLAVIGHHGLRRHRMVVIPLEPAQIGAPPLLLRAGRQRQILTELPGRPSFVAHPGRFLLGHTECLHRLDAQAFEG